MRINSIFYILISLIAGIVTLVAMPKSRKWVWQRVVNNSILRRSAIGIGMRIAPIRKNMLKRFARGFI